MSLLLLIKLALSVSAISIIISYTHIFHSVRDYILEKDWRQLSYLVNCPFCLSVWISMTFALLYARTPLIFVDWQVIIMMANLITYTFLRIAGWRK